MIYVIGILTTIDLLFLANAKRPGWIVGHLLASAGGIAVMVQYIKEMPIW